MQNIAQIILLSFALLTKKFVLIDFYGKKIYNYSVMAVNVTYNEKVLLFPYRFRKQ